VPGEKYLSRSGLRCRKLHILRFGPKVQSSFASLLLLFKMKQTLHFEKDVSPEYSSSTACGAAPDFGE
jgi:hypothetical protein